MLIRMGIEIKRNILIMGLRLKFSENTLDILIPILISMPVFEAETVRRLA